MMLSQVTLPSLPRPVQHLHLVQEPAVARLPAEQPYGFARVQVLVQGEGVREIAHCLPGFGEREQRRDLDGRRSDGALVDTRVTPLA
jgi:hypothetical protein